MELIAKLWLLFLAFTVQVCALKAESVSIHIENRRDYEILDQFFRVEFCEEEHGFVLEGVKPISVRNFYSLDDFPVAKDLKYSEKEFTNGLLVRETISVWNKLCAHQKNFVLKAVQIKDHGSAESVCEVQFINISMLREVIDKNINLFRYILSPAYDTEQLVNRIAYSEEGLIDILQNDIVLIGIVLGFEVNNSLVGGRIETINSQVISRDCAPFSSKSILMQSKREHSLRYLTPQCFGGHYLDYNGGDDSSFRSDFSPLRPSAGFSNIEDELLVLDAMHEPLPSSLSERPGFVFGAYKGGSPNQPFFERLQQVQKKIEALLKKPDFLECVLEKIGGKKPVITCDKSVFSRTLFSLFQSHANAQEWGRVLRSAASRFEDQSAFIEAFCNPSKAFRDPPMMVGASKALFEGLKKALRNLAAANAHFEMLSKDDSLQAIAAKQLYFKTTLAGSGKELKGADRVRMGYVIEDPEGNILFANHDTWLTLSQTIPGFAHGVQGMHVGEKRTLFVHPALAYGALTTLPPCMELIVKVHLLNVDEKSSGTLPSLEPRDLSWIQDPLYYRAIEESLDQLPRFIGSFYRDMLDKIEGLDKAALTAEVQLKKTVESF